MKKIKCIAVDDEPLALNHITRYVEKTPFLELVGKCSSPFDALECIENNPVDLIYLDIHMPDLSGIEFSSSLINPPKIIFTTAYEQYALESYKLNAIDYLLKPFNYEEFLKASNKAKNHYQLLSIANIQENNENQDELFIKSGYELIKIKISDINYIEGLKDYVKINLGEKIVLALLNLKYLEEKLAKTTFIRVHRSYIINIDKVKSIERNILVFENKNIKVTEFYRDDFKIFMEKKML